MPYRVALQPRRATGDLVTLRTYPDAVGARLDAACLEHNGVEAHVFDEGSHNMRGAMSGVRLQVRESEVDRARSILDAPEEDGRADETGDDDFGEVRCPRCELSYCSFERAQLSGGPLVVLALPLLFFAPKRWRCHRCGHVWDDEKAGPQAMTHLAKGDPVPTFRLRRGNGGMGLFIGAMIGVVLAWVASILRAPQAASIALALGAPLLGWRIGRAVRHDHCSVPTCRAVLAPSRESCPTCRAEIAGVVGSAEEHYSAAADVRRELAAMRAGQLTASET